MEMTDMNTRTILQAAARVVLLSIIFSMALSARPAGVYITGTVTRFGRPLPSVWVVISQNGGERGKALTDDDGKYYISNLGDGVYQIAVYRGDRRLANEQISLPGDTNHNIPVR
jgi:hypothetical protein